jgi:hypothetical protein
MNMADESTVVNQPQQTEGSHEESNYPSFLGNEPEMDDPATESPDPSAEESVEGEEAEAEAGEVEESTEGEQTEQAEDAFLASLSPQDRAYYERRYPTLFNAYQDPNQPADLRQAFIDRVNQDREFQKLREQSRTEEAEDLEDNGDAADQDPDQQRTAYYQQVDAIVSEVIDPKVVEDLGVNLLKGFGVDIASKDPEVQALVKNAPEVGKTLARGAVDLTATILPALLFRQDKDGIPYLGRLIENVFPGTLANFEKQQYADAWESVRNSNPAYKELPAYGTTDSAFGKLMADAAKQIPNFDKLEFRGTKAEQAASKYQLLAKIATGQKVTPATVAQAVQTGKRQVAERSARVNAGRVLGSGQSSQKFEAPNEDRAMDDLDSEIEKQNSSFQAFSKGKK